MSTLKIGDTHLIKGLDAVADAFSGTVYSDIINMSGFHQVEFVIHKGVGATGTSTITVEASDDVSATNVSAIAFHYQKATGADDVPGSVTAAAAAGFATTAGSSQLYRIYVDCAALAASGYKFVRLKAVEVVDSPVLGGILVLGKQARYKDAIPVTAIA